MLNTLIERILTTPDSRAADLYFRNACADFLKQGVRQIGPTVFASASTCVVMRHAMRAGPLPARRRLVYLVDDDIEAGSADLGLPFLYRQKLRMVERPTVRRLRRTAGAAVVGSPALARLLAPFMPTHLLTPYWSDPFADLGHFASDAPQDRLDIAYLGSAVNRAELASLLPVLARILAVRPSANLHLQENLRLPQGFERHPRVHRIPGGSWTDYRRSLAGRRFHLALYPLLDTPFNRARSVNKVIEHAVVGAAPIYSATWREGQRAAGHGAGILAPNDPKAWVQSILGLLDDRPTMRRLAQACQTYAATLNTAAPQRALWRDLLNLDAGPDMCTP